MSDCSRPVRGVRLPSPFDLNAPFSVAFYLRRLLRVRKEALAVFGGRKRSFSTTPTKERLRFSGERKLAPPQPESPPPFPLLLPSPETIFPARDFSSRARKLDNRNCGEMRTYLFGSHADHLDASSRVIFHHPSRPSPSPPLAAGLPFPVHADADTDARLAHHCKSTALQIKKQTR